MLLLLRTLRVILFALFARRSGILDESRITLRVWPNDCDLNFHLNDGRYVSLAGMGRVDLLTRTGMLSEARRRGWFPVVGGAVVRYRKSLAPFERFELVSRIVAWDEKWFFIEHRFERGDRSIAAVVVVRGVLRDSKGPVPTATVLDSIGIADVSPPIPDEIAKWQGVAL